MPHLKIQFIILHVIFCLIPTLITAQKVKVNGKVQDDSGQAVAYASVVAQSENSNTKMGVLTGENGIFQLELEKTVYELQVSVIGLEPVISSLDLAQKNSPIDLGIITINTSILMDEVLVNAESRRKIALDKKIYDVSKDLLVKGGNLLDVMQNIPSVQVEVDGGISIRGDANIQILIDGKLSGITKMSSFLRSFPATSIARIEVITNPSSKYNAEGGGGIINVILKKGTKKQLTGSAEVFTGIRLNSGVNLNINQRGNELSWYYNGGLGYSEPKAKNALEIDYTNVSQLDFNQRSERILKQFYIFNNAGGSWKLNKQHEFSADLTYRLADLNNLNSIIYTDILEGTINQISLREDDEHYKNKFFQARADYEIFFKNYGGNLKFSWLGQQGSETGNSAITAETTFPVNEIQNIDFTKNRITDLRNTYALDWTLPVNDSSQLELGMRLGDLKIDSDFALTRRNTNEEFLIPEFSGNSVFDQSILALYTQYGREFKQLSFQLGLRSETTTIAINSPVDDHKFKYTDLFPSGFINYKLNEKEDLRFSISRRISRPRRNALISFSSFTDSRNIFIGNPSLDPTYTISSELGYHRKFSNILSLTPIFFYKNSVNEQDYFITRKVVDVNGEASEIFVTSTVNVGARNTIGLELNGNYKPLSWFNVYTEFLISGFQQHGEYLEQVLNSSDLNAAGRLHLNFDLSENFQFQLQHRFRSGNESGQFKRKAVYRMDAALSKNLFDEKASLSLNAKDIFNTWTFRMQTRGSDFTQQIRSQIRTPQINLAFSYLFNQKNYSGRKGQQYDKLD